MLSEQTLWKARLVAVVVIVVVVHFSCNARTLVPPKSHTSCPRFVCSLFMSRCSQSQVILKHRETFFRSHCAMYIVQHFPSPSLVGSIRKMRRSICVRFALFCSSFIIAPERMNVNSFVPVIHLRDSSLTILCASL